MQNRLRTAAALFLLTAAPALAQTAPWSDAGTGLNGFAIFGMDFPSRTHGFFVASSAQGFADVHRTTDEGETWKSTRIEDMILFGATFPTTKLGFVFGIDEPCNCGFMVRSTDGGVNWTRKTFVGQTAISEIAFVDDKLGYASGSNGDVLFKTTDAGVNWSTMSNPAAAGTGARDLEFIDASTGWAVTANPGKFPTLIFKTTNGGTSWSKIQEFTDGRSINSLHFISPTVGWGSGKNGANLAIFKTTDGGASWKLQHEIPGYNELLSYYAIEFANENVGYAVGDMGRILRTTDGGAHWVVDGDGGGQTSMGEIAVIDTTTAWAAGAELGSGLRTHILRRNAKPKPKGEISAISLDFGEVSAPKEMSVTVSAASPAGLEIESIAINEFPGDPSGFSIVQPTGPFPIELREGGSLTVTVRFTPTDDQSTKITTMEIRTNDPGNATFYVTLQAEQSNMPRPSATVSTPALDFGDVPANGSKELTLTIAAANSAGLTVDRLTIDNLGSGSHGFSLVSPTGSLPKQVAQGSPMTVKVKFAPTTAAGTVQALLLIGTNDPNNPEVEVGLTGIASDPVAAVSGGRGPKVRPTTAIRTWPNPVTGSGTLLVDIPQAGQARVTLYCSLGSAETIVWDGHVEQGTLAIPIEAATLGSGVWFCVVESDGTRGIGSFVVGR